VKIKVNCLACGHPMELGDAYEDYEGEIRCWGCRGVLEVTLHEGKLQSMRLSTLTPQPIEAGMPEPQAPAIRVS